MSNTIKSLRKEYISRDVAVIRRLSVASACMLAWILVWMLVFKLGNEEILIRNYTNLKQLTPQERIMWDIIPFNYRGEGEYRLTLIVDTVLNCLIFVPLGVILCYVFKKVSVWRNAAICLGFSAFIEALQFLTMLGNPATEDLITNTAGCFIGYVIYRIIFARLSLKQSTRIFKLLLVLLTVATAVSFAMLIPSSDTIFKIITKTL